MADSTAPPRDLAFDLLRAGAVLYIVGYYHIQEIWVAHLPGALSGWLARIALALFCFLSGHLLGARTPIEGWTSAGRFYVRRLWKIYPLYFLALLAFKLGGLIPAALFWPSALLMNTLLNWNLLTLWFVSMIFLFYLLTPLYLFRASAGKTVVLTVLLLTLLIVVKWRWHGIDPRLFPNLGAFAFGILLNQSAALRRVFFEPARLILAGSALCFFVLGLLVNQVPHDERPVDAAIAFGWFVLVLPLLAALARKLARVVPAPAITFVATASFVLYLSHRIFYHWGDRLYLPAAPLLRQAYYLGVLLPAALVFSYYLQRASQRLLR